MSTSPIDYDRIADLYDTYVTTEADVRFFTSEAAGASGPVLELMAGTGRLSIPLVEAGAVLTSVDGSPRMLEVLARKLEARGLSATLHCVDVCALELASPFALVLLPFQSFMEIVGEMRQRAALTAVKRLLRPGGRFICTLHNPTLRRAHVDGRVRAVGWWPVTDGTLVVTGVEEGGDPVVRRLQFFEIYGGDGVLRSKRVLPMTFELVERDAFESMARDAGFRVAALYGDYERGPFVADASPVMIWVLEHGTAGG